MNWLVPKVGVSSRREASLFQNIAFRLGNFMFLTFCICLGSSSHHFNFPRPKKTFIFFEFFLCFLLALEFWLNWLVPKVGVSSRREASLFQNIAFRVDGKKVFNCRKSGVAHLAARGVLATHALGPKRYT